MSSTITSKGKKFQKDYDWAFDYTTKFYASSDDSHCGSESDDQEPATGNTGASRLLIDDLDLSTREEHVVYKPNPFSIAKINAAYRPTSIVNGSVLQSAQPVRPVDKPPQTRQPSKRSRARTESGQTTIMEGFKTQAMTKPRANALQPGVPLRLATNPRSPNSNLTINKPVAQKPAVSVSSTKSTANLLSRDTTSAVLTSPYAVSTAVVPNASDFPLTSSRLPEYAHILPPKASQRPATINPTINKPVAQKPAVSVSSTNSTLPEATLLSTSAVFTSPYSVSTAMLPNASHFSPASSRLPEYAHVSPSKASQLRPVANSRISTLSMPTLLSTSAVLTSPYSGSTAMPPTASDFAPTSSRLRRLAHILPPKASQLRPATTNLILSNSNPSINKPVAPKPAVSVSSTNSTLSTSTLLSPSAHLALPCSVSTEMIPNASDFPSSLSHPREYAQMLLPKTFQQHDAQTLSKISRTRAFGPTNDSSSSSRQPTKRNTYQHRIEDSEEEWTTLPSRKKKKPSIPRTGNSTYTKSFHVPGLGLRPPVKAQTNATSATRRVKMYLPPPPNSVDVRRPATNKNSEHRRTGPRVTEMEDQTYAALSSTEFDADAYPSPRSKVSLSFVSPAKRVRNYTPPRSRCGVPAEASYRPPSPPTSDLPIPSDAMDVHLEVDYEGIQLHYPEVKRLSRKRRRLSAEVWDLLGVDSCGYVWKDDDGGRHGEEMEIPIVVWNGLPPRV